MHKILLIALLLAFSNITLGACSEPDEPPIPDPNTAVTAEMVKAQNDVKQYLAAAEAFLKCTRNTSRHDKMVDRMKDLGDLFNQSVKAYKVRMQNS